MGVEGGAQDATPPAAAEVLHAPGAVDGGESTVSPATGPHTSITSTWSLEVVCGGLIAALGFGVGTSFGL